MCCLIVFLILNVLDHFDGKKSLKKTMKKRRNHENTQGREGVSESRGRDGDFHETGTGQSREQRGRFFVQFHFNQPHILESLMSQLTRNV